MRGVSDLKKYTHKNIFNIFFRSENGISNKACQLMVHRIECAIVISLLFQMFIDPISSDLVSFCLLQISIQEFRTSFQNMLFLFLINLLVNSKPRLIKSFILVYIVSKIDTYFEVLTIKRQIQVDF